MAADGGHIDLFWVKTDIIYHEVMLHLLNAFMSGSWLILYMH